MNNFGLFKKTFIRYQNLFGLNGYNVYFENSVLNGDNADITSDLDGNVVSVRLNKGLLTRPVTELAKHEAIHLLTNRLVNLAHNRFTRKHELEEATEEVVYKLEKLIPDLR